MDQSSERLGQLYGASEKSQLGTGGLRRTEEAERAARVSEFGAAAIPQMAGKADTQRDIDVLGRVTAAGERRTVYTLPDGEPIETYDPHVAAITETLKNHKTAQQLIDTRLPEGPEGIVKARDVLKTSLEAFALKKGYSQSSIETALSNYLRFHTEHYLDQNPRTTTGTRSEAEIARFLAAAEEGVPVLSQVDQQAQVEITDRAQRIWSRQNPSRGL